MASTHFLSLVDSAARARYCLTVCTFLPFLYHDCCVCNWLAMTSCFDEYVLFIYLYGESRQDRPTLSDKSFLGYWVSHFSIMM